VEKRATNKPDQIKGVRGNSEENLNYGKRRIRR